MTGAGGGCSARRSYAHNLGNHSTKMDGQRPDFIFCHLGLWGIAEVSPWTGKKAMASHPSLVSSLGWEIVALLYSASQLWVPSCPLARTVSLTLGCLSHISLDSSVMGPLLYSTIRKEAEKKTKYLWPCFVSVNCYKRCLWSRLQYSNCKSREDQTG